jgi:hypothetical protein
MVPATGHEQLEPGAFSRKAGLVYRYTGDGEDLAGEVKIGRKTAGPRFPLEYPFFVTLRETHSVILEYDQ